MSVKNVLEAHYIDISIPVLSRMQGVLPFDIYIKRSDRAYTKLFPKGEALDHARLTEYSVGKGVETLYVHKDDYKKYTFYVEQVAKILLENADRISAEDMSAVVKDMADLTMIEIFLTHHIDQDSMMHATMTMKGCVQVLAKQPRALVKVLKLLTWHPYQLKHSLACAIYSLLIAKLDGITSDKILQNIALGGFLHDLGMSKLSFDAEAKEDLTPQELKEIKEHPHLSKRILDQLKQVPPEVRMIAFQHHEQPNGLGYPNGLYDKEIYYPAKIVSIADGFSALTSPRPYRIEPYGALQALELMAEDRGHFDSRLLSLFTSLFAKIAKAA
ncbi:MAG: HD domain-containing protein [Xanthomonadaceae bacterium]|nr:HD domain-containing protein [Xanthomonadaceae bacterium]